ncbi:MAG: asparagine synthase (glutamine-hydrolyzing) [Planctomycetes bacterium]|nr:asparagine synthase (glutamine-hydrolyzing) [Planctomycetota bacterium]
MCGICGRFNFNGAPVDEGLIHRMCETIRHRGPDSEGIYVNPKSEFRNPNSPSVGLGIRRLSIIDLQTGDQPIHNENKSIWIVFNGEIYNFQELRQELARKGHHFYTKTDTEVIIHLYEDHGTDCLRYLCGMFAIAIWDGNKQQLFLARDRLGKKPLLYVHTGQYLIFASELNAILENPEIKRELDRNAIDYYLTYSYIPAPMTIFNGIHKLPPANFLLADSKGSVNIQRYWNLDYRKKLQLTEPEYCRQIMDTLDEATRIRLVSDVALGALLSGGIDSSAVVGLMAKHLAKPVKTFSIGFDEKDYSELAYARLVADRFKTEHYEFIVKPDAIAILPKLVWHYNEPYADSSMLPTYYVAQQTRKYVTVALNGDGGDENFAGYRRYLAHKFTHLPFFNTTGRVANKILKLLGAGAHSRSLLSQLKRFTDAAGIPDEQKYLKWSTTFPPALKQQLYSPQFAAEASNIIAGNYLTNLYLNAPANDLIDRLLYTDMMSYLPEDLLVKMDIATMANSLEGRSPFLDHKVVELTARIPSNLKAKGLTTKYILKKALKGFLPDKILTRRKMGFGVPIGHWFRTSLAGYLKETLLSDRSIRRGYFRKETLTNLIEAHTGGRQDYAGQLWSLLVLELWHRIFIDNEKP